MPARSSVAPSLTLLAFLPCLSPAVPADESLTNAVRNGDLAAVRMLLAHRANPNHRLPDGSTPLAWAVESANRDMVRLLLDRGAKPNGVRPSTVAPLIIACQQGDPKILDMLLSAGADARAARPDHISALSLCAGNAPAGVVKRLIAAGAEVDKADDKGQTPLMWAAAKGRGENIRLLLAHGAEVNRVTTEKGFTPLFFALKSGDAQAPVVVLDAGGNADYVAPDGTSVVQLAMYQKNYDFAARLIERGADLGAFDRNGYQLLHAAVLADQPPLVTLLLAKGADANALTGVSRIKMRFEGNFRSGGYEVSRKSPLLLAAERGSSSIMRQLADAGADSRFRAADATNVVLAAAASGNAPALEMALQLDPDPNATNSDGQTALHIILANGSGAEGPGPEATAMMAMLADKGARTDIKDHKGQTPADIAADPHLNVKTAFDAVFNNRAVSTL